MQEARRKWEAEQKPTVAEDIIDGLAEAPEKIKEALKLKKQMQRDHEAMNALRDRKVDMVVRDDRGDGGYQACPYGASVNERRGNAKDPADAILASVAKQEGSDV